MRIASHIAPDTAPLQLLLPAPAARIRCKARSLVRMLYEKGRTLQCLTPCSARAALRPPLTASTAVSSLLTLQLPHRGER